MSFSGVENQWQPHWLDGLNVPPGSGVSVRLSAGIAIGRTAYTLAGVAGKRHRVYRFWPRIADIPDALMARIVTLKPIVSLNRQEAQIAAERAGMDVDTLGVQWQHRYGAALIIRHDKDGAAGMKATHRVMFLRFPPPSSIPLAQATAMRAVRLPVWRQDGVWRMP